MATPRLVIPTSFPVTESGPYGGRYTVAPTPRPVARPAVIKIAPPTQAQKELQHRLFGGDLDQRESIDPIAFVQDNPITIATGLATAPFIPWTLGGVGVAGLLGMGARALDKTNPLSDKPSDYEAMDAAKNTEDILTTGAMAGLGQGLLGWIGRGAPRTVTGAVTDVAESTPAKGVYIGGDVGQPYALPKLEPVGSLPRIEVGESRVPKIMQSAEIEGLPEGYQIHNYEAYPQALEIDRQLAEAGVPRFVHPPRYSGLEQYLVGNPARNRLVDLPEGRAFEAAKALRDPILPDDMTLYSGVHGIRKYPFMSYDELKPKPNWSSDIKSVGETYAEAGAPRYKWKQMILDKIDQGVFNENNLPPGFESLDELIQTVSDPALYHHKIGESILRNEPEMIGMVQEYIPFASRVKQFERGGEYFQQPSIQQAQLRQAQQEGYDAVQYLNQRDPGPYAKSWVSQQEAHQPSTVHVALDPRQLKSIYNLGMWNLADPRILGTGIAAGLGANIAVQDNTRQSNNGGGK